MGEPAAAVLGYAPLVDRRRHAIGTRLTISAPDGDAQLAGALQQIDHAWPEARLPVLVAPLDGMPGLQAAFTTWRAPRNAVFEIPQAGFDAAQGGAAVRQLARDGRRLALRAAAGAAPPADVAAAIDFAVVAADGRAPAAALAGLGRAAIVVRGATTIAELEDWFGAGAAASLGWPRDTTAGASDEPLQVGQRTVIEVMRLARRDADVALIEAALKHDPAIAFKLLRLVNSSAAGSRVKITSLKHAVMRLGYAKLGRWMALLLATASREVDNLPLMYRSIRRSLFLASLQAGGGDPQRADDLFVVGAFSLLDAITGASFERLFELLALPDEIVDAIARRSGRYGPHLALIEAIERSDAAATRTHAAAVGLPAAECNQALLAALVSAQVLEQEGGL